MNTSKGQLGIYHMMIVSRFFNTIEDYINLELATPKCRGNMEKFHMNPIPLDSWSRKLFTSLETLHIYSKEDEHFPDEVFYKRIIHYEIDYEEWVEQKKENEEYKDVVLSQEVGFELQEIPEGVTKLGEGCFFVCDIISIIIPTIIKELPNGCFSWCNQLKEITIPTSITKLGETCFNECSSLTSLIIPTSVVEIGSGCFFVMDSLKEIEIPTSVTLFGESLFSNCSSLTSITVHDNYNEVKRHDFKECKSLSSIVLPSTVTKIGEYAFESCYKLTSINLENIKEYGNGCFFRSGMIKQNYPR